MIAIKPPMGWNSWNTFGKDINDSLIRQIADTMVEKGYLEAGYEYLIIDDCWSLKERDNIGNLVPDPEKFPNGMKSLADYIHSKGLKFGMYSCAGILTCAGYPSSYDHEFQDAALFAEWGIDYLKYDYCNFPKNADCINRYQTMSMALKPLEEKSCSLPATGVRKKAGTGCALSVPIPTALPAIFLTTSAPLWVFSSPN